ncbi:MAG: signal peptide peptidase SppA [Verrucomicrobia bacterium]|nr:signal peptide peptidase SppA [Verrucomicrobiota bacterium]MBI3870866.1 signal peptide peptidase SppA [Verrucomicrobiota bacterium]
MDDHSSSVPPAQPEGSSSSGPNPPPPLPPGSSDSPGPRNAGASAGSSPLPPASAPGARTFTNPAAAQPGRAPRSRGTGWKIGVALLCVGGVLLVGLLAVAGLFGGALSSVLGSGGGGGGDAKPHLQEVVKESGNSHERVLIIPIEGVISGSPIESVGYSIVELVKDQLETAGKEDDVKAVILRVDSPGGEVLASDDLYKLLVEFQDKHHKPIVAAMGNLAASGGYYVSAPCRWIVANPLTITGSIGVIMHGYNYRGLMDKVGLRPEVFKSGRFKDMLSGEKREEEISTEERDMVQRMVNETFFRFKEVVKEGREKANKSNAKSVDSEDRGRTLSPRWADYADGRILSGKEAHELGFVDELGGFKVAVDRVKRLAKLDKPELIELRPVFEFSRLLRLLGSTSARPVSVDLGVHLPKLKPGCMYFVWPMALP